MVSDIWQSDESFKAFDKIVTMMEEAQDIIADPPAEDKIEGYREIYLTIREETSSALQRHRDVRNRQLHPCPFCQCPHLNEACTIYRTVAQRLQSTYRGVEDVTLNVVIEGDPIWDILEPQPTTREDLNVDNTGLSNPLL
ncbi:unnamed protein product [Toxocara canis]|uniref:Uncharacterized protein n=1 Tax=Toxocara canis TaxID=6265 RepID=A0A183UEU1_TOXCA|nr:unnamed protein product [Toxocara canis]